MHKTIVVVDGEDHQLASEHLEVVSFERYLNDYPKRNEPKTRLINLCDTEYYLSRGYYCSLLAEARQHKVLPSVSTINDLRALSAGADDGLNLAAFAAEFDREGEAEFLAYFGWAEDERWTKLTRRMFERYPAPILWFRLSSEDGQLQLTVRRHGYNRLDAAQRQRFGERLVLFTEQVWRNSDARKQLRWDLAILVNPDEAIPPSDAEAIKRFIKAAAKVGMHAETITAAQASQIAQYDALFIRETTAIDHHTYRLARKAEREGLVVIDDSASILRCCNKVFLHDAFSYHRVPSLKTRTVIGVSEAELDEIEAQFSYPCVLKMPEGSFSKGIYKVADRAELKSRLQELLSDTALVLVQEYMYTDFDWRVGVLAGRAIYACRYHMARDHWQIYNHGAKRFASGGYETLPTFEVPKVVLDAALKASRVVGKGCTASISSRRDTRSM
ncbi:RimK family protein [Kineobactrum salinum]|uniref:RimK family protein n=1 Tax=Kineobactrum salinum TaxID=2708301 RepID=UPI001E5669DE|nr:RimK family protein [Kineobactrum salinum]